MERDHHWWFVCSSSCLQDQAGGGVGPHLDLCCWWWWWGWWCDPTHAFYSRQVVVWGLPRWPALHPPGLLLLLHLPPPHLPAACWANKILVCSSATSSCNSILGINLWNTLILQTTKCGICNSTTNFTDWCNYPPQLLPRQKHPRGAERAITSSEIKRPGESKSVSHRERHRGPDVAVLASVPSPPGDPPN